MPVTELILWQNVPAGSHADVGVLPLAQPIVSDAQHTFGGATLEAADDLQLRPGPHTFRQFTQLGDHAIDIRTANLGTSPIVVVVTATLFDSGGNTLAGPNQKPRTVPPNDHYLVTIMAKVIGVAPSAGGAPAPAGLAAPSSGKPKKKSAKKSAPKKNAIRKKNAPKKPKRTKGGK